MHRNPRPFWPGFTLLSGGYIVVFRPWCHWHPPMTLIQAFVAPDPLVDLSHTDISQLRLTHEVLVERGYQPTHRLRGAIVDPDTGETSVRFLSHDFHEGKFETHYLCIDITIPPPSLDSTEVLPLSVSMQELFVLSGDGKSIFLGASNDGHGRGIVTLSLIDPIEPTVDCPLVFYKFSVDASGEHCTAMVSEPTELKQYDVFPRRGRCVFDGVRGRFCHDHDREARTKFYDLVVLSFN